MNKANYKLVLDTIKSCPHLWDQSVWHCGSRHCFAGWAQLLSGNAPNEATVRHDARKFLGLSLREANYLFETWRELNDFEKFKGFTRKQLSAGAVTFFDFRGYDPDHLDAGLNTDPEWRRP